MDVKKTIIVAVEFSSTKAIGIAGYKRTDGELQVLAIISEPSEKFIRKGIIYNLDKAEHCIRTIRDKLQISLQMSISQVYVAINGMGIHTRKNVEIMNFDEETSITEANIDELMDRNLQTVDNDWEILEVVPQEYKVGMRKHIDPKGVLAKSLEGNYINIVAPPSLQNNIKKSFELANLPIAGMFVSPLILGENLLTELDRRSGCVLVDFGADTTTVAIYKENILRRLCVIPLGGKNITYDIAKLEIDEDEAEELKINYGSAFNAYNQKEYEEYMRREHELNDHRIIKHHVICEYTEARVQEILENVNYQIIHTQYGASQFRAGIFLTGIGSYLTNIKEAVNEFTGFDKINTLKTQPVKTTSKRRFSLQEEMKYSTLFSLLLNDLENCNGGEIKVQSSLFDELSNEKQVTPPPVNDAKVSVDISTLETSKREEKLKEDALKKKKEEEENFQRISKEKNEERLRLQKEQELQELALRKEEEEKKRKEEERKSKEEEKNRKKEEKKLRRKEKHSKFKSSFTGLRKRVMHIANDLVSDEDEDSDNNNDI